MRHFYFLILSTVFIFNLQSQSAVYNFTIGSGADASGNGNNGTLFGNAALGDSLVIDSNTNNYFQMPASLLNSKVAFSIVFKVKFNVLNLAGPSPTNHLFSGDLQNLEGSFATSYQKDINTWYFVNGTSAFAFIDASIVANQWYCVALIRDQNGLIKMYVDGVQNPTTFINTTPLSMTNLILGQETDCFAGCFAANQSSHAKFDYLNIYASALTLNDIVNVCANNNVSAVTETIKENFSFQNPVSDELSIENAQSIQMIELVSIDGKRLLSVSHNQDEIMKISTLELKPGIYCLNILSGNTKSSFRIIKD